jgi:hypothetical protein
MYISTGVLMTTASLDFVSSSSGKVCVQSLCGWDMIEALVVTKLSDQKY